MLSESSSSIICFRRFLAGALCFRGLGSIKLFKVLLYGSLVVLSKDRFALTSSLIGFLLLEPESPDRYV